MGPAPVIQSTAKRDCYIRPTPQYNHNYDIYKKPSNDIRCDYSPYVYGEPLYDDRPIIVARLPRYYTKQVLQRSHAPHGYEALAGTGGGFNITSIELCYFRYIKVYPLFL
jgi:hypothetical protein